MFKALLTREGVSDHIFLSDAQNLMKSMAEDFPEVVKIKSLG